MFLEKIAFYTSVHRSSNLNALPYKLSCETEQTTMGETP